MCTKTFSPEQETSLPVAWFEEDYSSGDGENDPKVCFFFCPACEAALEWFPGYSGESVACWNCEARTNGWLIVSREMLLDVMVACGFESEDQAFEYVRERTPNPILQ